MRCDAIRTSGGTSLPGTSGAPQIVGLATLAATIGILAGPVEPPPAGPRAFAQKSVRCIWCGPSVERIGGRNLRGEGLAKKATMTAGLGRGLSGWRRRSPWIKWVVGRGGP